MHNKTKISYFFVGKRTAVENFKMSFKYIISPH